MIIKMKNKKIFILIILCFLGIFFLVIQNSLKKYFPKIKDSSINWQEMNFKYFSVKLPKSFKYSNVKSQDSFAGKISNDSITFNFDFGWYSPSLIETEKEYLDGKEWITTAEYAMMKDSVVYDNTNYPRLKVLSIIKSQKDSGNYIANLQYKDSTFTHKIIIPETIKKHKITIDTVDNIVTKTVLTQDSEGSMGIYLIDLESYNKGVNSYNKLSFVTSNVSNEHRELVKKILNTVQLRSKE